MAGRIIPKKFPRWSAPEGWMPDKILIARNVAMKAARRKGEKRLRIGLARRRSLAKLAPMSETDWEQRYQTGDMPWEKGEPSPGLVDFLASGSDLQRGNVA